MGALRELKDVELFSVGKHTDSEGNTDVYTTKDLDDMVASFDELRATIRPRLKLGHDKTQKLLQEDGLPAAGWGTRLFRRGDILVGDFGEVPEKIHQLIKNGAYKKISSEVLWNATINGKKYRRVLDAAALLGADLPALTCLADVVALYGHESTTEIKSYEQARLESTLKSYSIELGGDAMPEKTQAEIDLEAKLKQERDATAEQERKFTAEKEKREAAEKEVIDLRKFKAEQEVLNRENAEKLAEAEIDKTVAELVSERLISPAMKPYARALLGTERKEYSVKSSKKAKDGKTETTESSFTKPALFKEILKLFKAGAGINTEEQTTEGELPENADVAAQEKEVQDYATTNKVTYSAAYKVVMKKYARKRDVKRISEDETE